MNSIILKTSLIISALVISFTSCKKDSSTHPNKNGHEMWCILPNSQPVCNSKAVGFVYSCFPNTNSWYIKLKNSNQDIRVYPTNLPNSYKVNGLFVSFNYSLTGDSTAYCYECLTGVNPLPYAKNITICSFNSIED